jgi:hypothetical protein
VDREAPDDLTAIQLSFKLESEQTRRNSNISLILSSGGPPARARGYRRAREMVDFSQPSP